MGWGRALLMGDIGNMMDIQDVGRDVSKLKRRLSFERAQTERHEDAVAELAQENAELKLYLSAVVRLLISKSIVKREELEAIVEEIDRSDGQQDGRFDGPIA